jgi:DNA-binding CsgD family transcriptional regulator
MPIPAEHIERYLEQLNIEQIKKICSPLKEHLGLTSFVYRKCYNDGTEINISNQPEWVKHFYTNKDLIQESTFDKHPDHYESGVVLWSQLKGHQTILEHARKFNIDHGITIIKKIPDGVELAYFGTTSNCPHVVGNYINNIDLLERFILYFKEQASETINHAEQHRILIPHKFDITKPKDEDLKAMKANVSRDAFLKATTLHHFKFEGQCKGLTFSGTEIRIIEHLLKGMTSEETGKAISRSPRTVEDYLSQLREKLNVKTKSQLIQKLIQSEFIAYLPQKP